MSEKNDMNDFLAQYPAMLNVVGNDVSVSFGKWKIEIPKNITDQDIEKMINDDLEFTDEEAFEKITGGQIGMTEDILKQNEENIKIEKEGKEALQRIISSIGDKDLREKAKAAFEAMEKAKNTQATTTPKPTETTKKQTSLPKQPSKGFPPQAPLGRVNQDLSAMYKHLS